MKKAVQLMQPLLKALDKLGGSGTINEIYDKVVELEKFDAETLAILHVPTKPGKRDYTEIGYQLAWAKTFLKKAGYLDNPSHGVWSLTDKGKNSGDIDTKKIMSYIRSLYPKSNKGNQNPPNPATATAPDQTDENFEDEDEAEITATPIKPYLVDNIIEDGAFIDRDTLAGIIERLRTKKNIILQGPPGTGKSWLAKRLAFALIGQKNNSKIRHVQFHPNLSYEDFVRGWRPSGDGKLTLVDGPFLEMIDEAKQDTTSKYVIVIEEINRGNPAQIFGEMLTLLEADKRKPNEAIELTYRRNDRERIFIPSNLYVIGTMNIADRSLALVDLALRRRFAYINLEPTFGLPWRNWVHTNAGVDMSILKQIEERILKLNNEIKNDKTLGAQFRIGHSYVTPAFSDKISDAVKWYKDVVKTEIGPLLDEYWFDDLDRAQKARDALIKDM